MASIPDFIDEQPDVLARIMRDIPRQFDPSWFDPKPARLYLVGSGTSRNALEAVRYGLGDILSCDVCVTNPHAFMTLVPEKCLSESAGLFLSQMGTSTTTIEALQYARARGVRTLALTAERESPFAAEADTLIIMPIGNEPLGPKTKGYTGSIAAMLVLIELMRQHTSVPGGSETKWEDVGRDFVSWFHDQLPEWHKVGKALAMHAQHLKDLAFFAVGRHLATAAEASLKVTEMAGLPASVFDAEEGFHGRFHGLGRTSLAVLITSSGPEKAWMPGAVEVLAQLNIPTLLVTHTHDDLPTTLRMASSANEYGLATNPAVLEMGVCACRTIPALDLLSTIVPFQYLAYHLALLHGIRPELMRYPSLSARLGIKRYR